MANRLPPTPHYADNSSGLQTAACNVWRRGDADSVSARDTHDPNTDAGYTTAGALPQGPQSVSPLLLRGSPYAALPQPLVLIGAPVPQIPCWHGPPQSPPQMPDIRLQAIPQQPKHQSVSCPCGGVHIRPVRPHHRRSPSSRRRSVSQLTTNPPIKPAATRPASKTIGSGAGAIQCTRPAASKPRTQPMRASGTTSRSSRAIVLCSLTFEFSGCRRQSAAMTG